MSRLAVTITLLAVLILWEPLSAAPPAARPQKRGQTVHDIQLKQGNFFRGQLPPDAFPKSKQGVLIRFFRKNRLIAETKTDDLGRFTLRYLPVGTGVLAVSADSTDKGAKVCFCRLWAPGTAPPKPDTPVATSATTGAPSTIARAQDLHVFPMMSFKEVATTVGVVGGAIAVPVIWHNIQQDHKAPVSGS